MGLRDEAFEVICPDCGATIKVDPVTRAMIAHTPAPRKRTFEDFTDAAKALREADARRDRDDLMAKKFAEAVKKAKESPLTERPLRDFDLE
jgi:hypothetical protein